MPEGFVWQMSDLLLPEEKSLDDSTRFESVHLQHNQRHVKEQPFFV